MALTTHRLLKLYTGDSDSAPCYRYHLAHAIVERLQPHTAEELYDRIYHTDDMPDQAAETLIAAYLDWRTHHKDTTP